MPAEASLEISELAAKRRVTDTAVLPFAEAKIKSVVPFAHAFEDGEIEVINLDVAAPGGNADDFEQKDSPPSQTPSTLTREQIKARVLLSQFKQSFESFDQGDHLMQVTMTEVKRGDVIAIKTIVGVVYLSIRDRIKGLVAGTGEILCECHYDLGDRCDLVHAASIQLPICTRTFTILTPDGNKRNASRQLKMRTDAELPAHVMDILHERFFVEISIYANPKPEKPRLVDFGRWLLRIFHRMKAAIEANNQREREKKLKKEQERQARKAKQEELPDKQ